jgi:hypothetical protein
MARAKSKSPKAKPKPDFYQSNIRINPKLAEALKQCAAWHGDRSFNAEVEAAIEVHVTESMLVGLHEPTFVSDLIQADPEFDVEAFKEATEDSLRALKKRAYSRKPNQLEDVMARMAK